MLFIVINMNLREVSILQGVEVGYSFLRIIRLLI